MIEELRGHGIINALQGHQNLSVAPQVDPDTGHTEKIWITFSDPAVLEIEATVVDGEPALAVRLHRRRNASSPL